MLFNKIIEQINKNSNNIAIKTTNETITYKELNSFTNCIANQLMEMYDEIHEQNNNSKNNVALLFEHSKDMIIGTLGAVKSNITYIPLQSTYPIERLAYIINDADVGVILTDNKNEKLAFELVNELEKSTRIININSDKYKQLDCQLNEIRFNNEIAYIMYTSGSTGKPKGVYQSYKNLLHFIENYIDRLCITNEDRMTLFSTIGHDASLVDIYSSLLSGATLYPVDVRHIINFESILKWLNDEKITIWHSVPTVYRYLVKSSIQTGKYPHLRYIVLGGEQVIENDLKSFSEIFLNTRLVNLYGQTESSINSMEILSSESDFNRITLGTPIRETELVVVDENREEADLFRIGEIVILSDYVALGYWKNKELTQQVFKFNDDSPNLYWTGDLGRALEDGTIEFIGRKNAVVKIRGHRIDIGDVESNLLEYKDISQIAVINLENDSGEDNLYAFLVSDSDLDIETVREFAYGKLPEYMIPTQFFQLDKLPTTQSGKVDRKQLIKELELRKKEREYVAPRNKDEETLVDIWKEVLEVEKVSINDNFFELGGHSLKATLLVNKVHKKLSFDVKLRDLFQNPTVKELWEFISNGVENKVDKIQKVEEREYYKASSAQKRIFMLQQMDKAGIAYNMVNVYKIKGEFDRKKIQQVFRKIVSRHDVLRTRFQMIDGSIVQKIDNEIQFDLVVREENDKTLEEIKKDFVRPFNLEKSPLFRVEIVDVAETSYLFIDIHHIIADASSIGILIKDFVAIYNGGELEPLSIQYKDFSQWQNKFLESEKIKKEEDYWISRFNDEIEGLNLPYDYERPAIQNFEGDSLLFDIGEEYTEGLRRIANETKTTTSMVMLSVLNILLSKYSNQEDIVIGMPIAGRLHADLEDVIGMFVNTLAIRNSPSKEKTYMEFLEEVKESCLSAYENQSYQFEMLIDKLDLKRDMSRNPLFDVVFNMINIPFGKNLKLEDLELEGESKDVKTTKFDLTFNTVELENNIEISVEYATKLFKKETVERMCSHFLEIIKNMCNNCESEISEIKMLTEEEERRLLKDFNDTKADFPEDKTIHQLFEAQVDKTPSDIAVVCGNRKLTYKELNQKSNQLARTLRNKGVQADTIVGIMLDRSVEMIIGIMGILKSGGAYLPIDSKNPKKRIEQIIKDSDLDIIVTSDESIRDISFNGRVVDINNEDIFKEDNSNLDRINQSNDLAYVIYTSGSTGNPKGVMIEHRQVNNFIHAIVHATNLDKYESILCITTISFDIFGLETLVPLTKGMKIVVSNDEEGLDGEKLSKVMKGNNIDVMQSTPSRFKLLLENSSFKKAMEGLKIVLVGGEELPKNVLESLQEYKNINIFNVYGPTETTIWSTIKSLNNEERITIGQPINNTKIYILDKNRQIVPIGVPGELCIGGDGVARGYLDRDELTSEKFIENPYSKGEKIYRTGDLAKWLPNGELQFLGRIDKQVKIRGYRVELGEIENLLLKHEGIKEAIVALKDNKKYLCAYIVCDDNLEIREVMEYLKSSLPNYMIPSHFVKLDKVPLTLNGKIDYKKLLKIESINVNREKILPRNLQENVIVEIWEEVLGINEIYIKDDFFELGGNSLNIIQVAQEINERLKVEISIADLMVNTKVIDLADYIIKNNCRDTKKYKHIYKINKGTSDKKIFIVHGADGDIFYFRHLAKLLEDEYSVYGIQPKGLNGKVTLPLSFYEMLNDYIKEIRSIQPEGPYIFAGYCIGGYLSYDITKIFELQGEKVQALIEIDQEPFVHKKICRQVKYHETVLKLVELWRKLTKKDEIYTIEKMKRLFEKKHEISKEQQMEIISNRTSIRKFFGEELMPKGNYTFFARSINTPTLVVKAEENDNKLFKTESWEDMTQNKLDFYEIPGNHETIVLPPNVEELSRLIIQFLNEGSGAGVNKISN